jgi:hypothetical protein
MREILPMLCILSITIGAKAQLFGKHWEPGSYYDLQGIKHTGLVSWSPPQKSLFSSNGDCIFYEVEQYASVLKVKSGDLKSFTCGADSFVVTHDERFSWKPFLNVFIDVNDSLKLYRSMETRSSPGVGFGVGGMGAVAMSVGASYRYSSKIYYYGPNPDHVIKIDKKNFVEVTSKILADKPEIVDKIKSNDIRDMEDVEVALQQWAYSKARRAKAALSTK